LALKVLTQLRTDSSRALERFQLEGRLAASINHPRCVYVYSAEEIDGLPAISMELMEGGTLSQRLADGPVPTTQAVDYVLDVIDGLEAAQQVGIIHRDIKPSNCFLDEAGRAKIGDFGISKSLEGDGALSMTGSFLGTPYYASPEQVSGEPLDVRSDLYSVGAMLYELLSGKPPFTGGNPGQVIAQVLTKPPPPLGERGVTLPHGLQAVVFRLLAKQREKRYPNYQALRHALIPFSSRGLGPADLARRFGAIVIDTGLFFAAGVPLGLADPAQARLPLAVGTYVAEVAYFGITEGFFGGSIGKRLLGLRVVSATGEPASLGRASYRAALFTLFVSAGDLLSRALATARLIDVTMDPWVWTVVGVNLLLIGLMVSTMRKANGFAGIHELASGTRVVALRGAARLARVPAIAPVAQLSDAASWSSPPFRVVSTLWEREGEALFLGRDDDLRRDVWIHRYRDPSSAPGIEMLSVHRAGRLPWIQRAEKGGLQWDVYGALEGVPLTRWVQDRGGLTWRELRGVLVSLAAELEGRFADGGAFAPVTLAHVWVRATGEAVLLDFPADLTDGGPLNLLQRMTPDNWSDFLRRVVVFGLDGMRATGIALPRIPMPVHAREVLRRLFAEPSEFATPGELRAALDRDWNRPTEVTLGRRIGSLAIPVLLLLPVVVVTIMVLVGPRWPRDLSQATVYAAEAGRLERESLGAQPDSVAARTLRSLGIVLSATHSAAHQTPAGRTRFASLPESTRIALAAAAQRYPAPDLTELVEARHWLAGRFPSQGTIVPAQSVARRAGQLLGLGLFGIIAVGLTLVFRGGPVLHLFGITVQRRDGSPASRWRCGLRSFVAWSPFFATMLLKGSGPGGVPFTMVLLGIAAAGVVWSALEPERGPADRVAGTVLVPK
jgi:uncharacterized RDD family membrane protein YckC